MPVVVTGPGALLAVVPPLPCWPLELAPQQSAAPALVSAHAKLVPALIWVKVSPPRTSTGTSLLAQGQAVVLLPSWPLPLAPQQ